LVCTPEQAVASFFATGLDRLVIGGFLVSKA
jgi:predicted NodU family carbamoyl transferase